MQRERGDKIQLGDTLNPLNDACAVPAIDNTSKLKDVFGKIDKLGDLWDRGKADTSLIRYLPWGGEVSRQGKIFNIVPKKEYASLAYTDKKTLEFTIELAANTYTNYNMMTLVVPIYFGNRDRRLNKIDTPANRTNANLSGRITDFHGSLKNIYILQNSVRFICISKFSKLST